MRKRKQKDFNEKKRRLNKLLENKELKKIAPEIKKYLLAKSEKGIDEGDFYSLLTASKNYKVIEGKLDKVVERMGKIAKKAKGVIFICEGTPWNKVKGIGEKITESVPDDTNIIWSSTELGKEKIKVVVVY